MISKHDYTKTFLNSVNLKITDDLIKAKMIEWWYNVREKDQGGMRLTDLGLEFIQSKVNLKTYSIKLPGHVVLIPQLLVWLDQQMNFPFHINKKEITVISEKDAFEIYLFSGDVMKMGYNKALSKRLNLESS
jgi:hypothetical protein